MKRMYSTICIPYQTRRSWPAPAHPPTPPRLHRPSYFFPKVIL